MNLLAETATVSLASALQGGELASAAEALRQAIEDVGFEATARPPRQALGTKASQLEAPVKVLEFEVLGMTCGSCSATVERALRSTPDVAVAGVEVAELD